MRYAHARLLWMLLLFGWMPGPAVANIPKLCYNFYGSPTAAQITQLAKYDLLIYGQQTAWAVPKIKALNPKILCYRYFSLWSYYTPAARYPAGSSLWGPEYGADHPEVLLKTADGWPIKAVSPTANLAVDIGRPDVQSAAMKYLPLVLQYEHADGLFMDLAELLWDKYTMDLSHGLPVGYPRASDWAGAECNFLLNLNRGMGLPVVANSGGCVLQTNPTADWMSEAKSGTGIFDEIAEFWTDPYHYRGSNPDWRVPGIWPTPGQTYSETFRQNMLLSASSGVTYIHLARTGLDATDPANNDRVEASLAFYLRYWEPAAKQYLGFWDGQGRIWCPYFDAVAKLGMPTEPGVRNRRYFAGGVVFTNTGDLAQSVLAPAGKRLSGAAIQAGAFVLAPHSGLIVLQ